MGVAIKNLTTGTTHSRRHQTGVGGKADYRDKKINAGMAFLLKSRPGGRRAGWGKQLVPREKG